MMATGQRTHPDLSLPVRLIRLLIACLTFLDNPTLARSLCAISPSIDADNIRLFVGAVNGAAEFVVV
jgi:hypothetical protein